MSASETLDVVAAPRPPVVGELSGAEPPAPGLARPRRVTWRRALRRDWQLYSLAIVPLLFFAVFRYLPMIGNVIAFRRFRLAAVQRGVPDPGHTVASDDLQGHEVAARAAHEHLRVSDLQLSPCPSIVEAWHLLPYIDPAG